MDWSFTYPSQRMPVIAANVVATSQPLATQAGVQALRDGGSAADAALCAAMTLTVVEPTANGIGSDAFALVWDGEGAPALKGINSSGRSPAGQSRDAFGDARDSGGTAATPPRLGWPAVTVPGCVAMWAELHRTHGRLPFARLVEPAIHYAERGFPVSPMTAAAWSRAVDKYRRFPAWMATFARTGRGPAPGEWVTLPDHGRTLREIAETKGESFYRGAIARAIADAARTDGAAMRESDLAAHAADWVEPWTMDYGGVTLHEVPPNGQGLAALVALGILRSAGLGSMRPDSAEWVHTQVEAMKAALVDAHAQVADPACGLKRAAALLEPEYLQARAAGIDARSAQLWTARQFAGASTVYLCAADARGCMVSYIQSNYEGFGSGVVVPGTGIAMQNRGACFTLERGHPNEYAPGKRPFHTIIPGFLTRGTEPLAAFGVMGGAMQAQGHVQVVARLVDQGLNPQSALDAPRWQVMEDGSVALERGFSREVEEGLRARGHAVKVVEGGSVFFGGAQVALRADGGPVAYIGASDPRRDGQAAGF